MGEALQETIDAILRAATEGGTWEDAIDRVCFELRAPAAALFMSDDLVMKSKATVFSDFWRAPDRAAIPQRFEQDIDVSADAPAYSLFRQLPPQKLMREVDVFGLSSSADLPYSEVRELTLSFGFKHRVASVLNASGPWIDVLTFQVKSETLVNEKYDLLATTLSSAMRMRHLLRDARKNAIVTSKALNRMPIGVFALTNDGWMVFTNSEADRQFSEVEQVSNRGGVVCFSGLSEKLGDAAPDTSPVPLQGAIFRRLTKQTFVLASRDNETPVIGQIEPMTGLYDGTAWLVFTFDLKKLRNDDGSLLGRLGGLTRAETDVLRLLAQGKAVSEIATIRGTSRITTRNQLKSIMEKLRCSSQKDLIALSASTSLARLG